MTRILVVTDLYPPHHYGGYELSCRDVVERLHQRGHEVTVLTSMRRRSDVETVADGSVEVRRELREYWQADALLTPSLAGRARLEWHNRRVVRRALGQVRPDVISFWNLGAVGMSVITHLHRSGVPMVFHVCNDWPHLTFAADAWMRTFASHPVLASLVERVTRLPARPPDLGECGAFCWVSDAVHRWAEERTPWTFPLSATVYSGFDPSDFPVADPPPVRDSWDGLVVYAGRIVVEKGVDVLVDVLPLMEDLRVQLIGTGEGALRYDVYLTQRAAALGVDNRLEITELPRDQVADRFRAADAVVFASAAEPFGLVPLEAMAVGTPVAAAATGGSAEFLRDGENMVAFDHGDPESLAAALGRLRDDAGLRRRVQAGGTATAAQFTVDRLADRLEEWLVAASRGYPEGPPPPARPEIPGGARG